VRTLPGSLYDWRKVPPPFVPHSLITILPDEDVGEVCGRGHVVEVVAWALVGRGAEPDVAPQPARRATIPSSVSDVRRQYRKRPSEPATVRRGRLVIIRRGARVIGGSCPRRAQENTTSRVRGPRT
jgi:hypothetical protein